MFEGLPEEFLSSLFLGDGSGLHLRSKGVPNSEFCFWRENLLTYELMHESPVDFLELVCLKILFEAVYSLNGYPCRLQRGYVLGTAANPVIVLFPPLLF